MSTIAVDARHIRSTTGRYVNRLVQGLALDTSHQYVLLMRPSDIDRFLPVAAHVTAVEAPFPLYSPSEQVGLLRLLNSLKADLVHFCMPSQPALYRGRTVTTFHDLTQLEVHGESYSRPSFVAKQRVARFVYGRAARKARLIITPSNWTREECIRFAKLDESKVRVTYEAADDLGSESEPVAALEGKRFLLYVGTHAAYKNISRLIAAHQELRREDPNLCLAFAGTVEPLTPGSAFHTRQWTQSMGYDGITYTGYVSDSQLLWLYQNTAAYAFPSLSEGFGLPGLEAMAHGAPVVSSRATCLPEVYGDAALYFDPLDIKDMVRCLGTVLNDKAARDDLIALGCLRARLFSWSRMVQQTLEIYEEAIA